METEASAVTCERCESTKVMFCEGCVDYYCDDCWETRRVHKENRRGPGGTPHVKSDPDIVRKIEEAIAEPKDELDEKQQHADDGETIWFGLDRNGTGDRVIAEYRRYAALMMETSPEPPIVRHPGLVSFVGQTGAGKSTLVRLLMDSTSNTTRAAGPVIGRAKCEQPTSADVHLYMDPRTRSGERAEHPILFADCEGFEGGERDPIAQTALSDNRGLHSPIPSNHHDFREHIARSTRRVLKWASRNSPDHEKTCKRQYAVTEMYPRIFHTFSDVIVFVLNNPKTMEGVVERLLQWAHANHSSSINRPTKPHAIIALNRSPNSTDDRLWSSAEATAQFLREMKPQIRQNKTFRGYVESWEQEANVEIHDMEALFKLYYSSVHVVRLPDKSRYQLIHRQRDLLYDVIKECCQMSHEAKGRCRMLPDAEKFGLYLSLALDHFSQSLLEPFDFIKASLKYNPPPETLGDNILHFAVLVAERLSLDGQVEELFDRLIPMVASCLLLDSVRKQRFGKPKDWFGSDMPKTAGSNPKVSGSSYRALCKFVVQEYFDLHVTCSFHLAAGPFRRGFQCELKRRTHHFLNHQESTRTGMREYIGDFKHHFDPEKYCWEKRILRCMRSLQKDYNWGDNHSSRQVRGRAHRETLRQFYGPGMKADYFLCNSVCLCCLSNAPQHRLACGHIICLECALDFGRFDGKTEVTVDSCPLHDQNSGSDSIQRAAKFHISPQHSGLRLLILDGGGIRGIVELCVLKAIEFRIGVPLRHFFDVVVGTSTGGIISLGFGHKLWSIDECIKTFVDLVAKAFTLRRGQKFLGIRHLEIIVKRSRYETKGIEDALKSVFDDSILFAPMETEASPSQLFKENVDKGLWKPEMTENRRPLKVAVTTAAEAGTSAYVLSNYNVYGDRLPDGELRALSAQFIRHRPSKPADEYKVWQAARATSAAPGYFKPFANDSPEFVDGGTLHNNPVGIAVGEAQRLALAGNQCSRPDIVLSLGTGLPGDYEQTEDDDASGTSSPGLTERAESLANPRRKTSLLKMLFTMARYQMKLNLDSEGRWKQWSQRLSHQSFGWGDRLYRINPDLGKEPPLMDAVNEVGPLRDQVTGWAQRSPAKERIEEVACVLVGSSFYFERSGNAAEGPSSSIELRGTIRCRLEHEPEAMKALGRFLSSSHGAARFVLFNHGEAEDSYFDVPVQQMLNDGRFEGVPLVVTIPGEDTETTIALKLKGLSQKTLFPLSGFPRKLMKHDFGPRQF